MSKIALLFVAFIALSTAQVDVPVSLFQGNYDNFKTYINAFMNGYTNSNYVLPTTCLDSASQGKLDTDMVDAIISLLKFHPYDAFIQLKTFGRDFDAMSKLCGLNQVPINLEKDLEKKGSFWVVGNMLLHKIDIEAYLVASLTELVGGNFAKAGKNFGIAVRYLIPPYSTVTGELMGASTPAGSWMTLGKGLLDGLEGQVTATGACYNSIVKLSDNFEFIYQSIEKVLSKNLPAMDTLIAAIKLIQTEAAAVSTSCPFETLFETMQSSFTSTKGFKALYTNYYKSLSVIDADLKVMLNCSADLYACGKSAGNAIDLLFGWNLEKPSKTQSFLSF